MASLRAWGPLEIEHAKTEKKNQISKNCYESIPRWTMDRLLRTQNNPFSRNCFGRNENRFLDLILRIRGALAVLFLRVHQALEFREAINHTASHFHPSPNGTVFYFFLFWAQLFISELFSVEFFFLTSTFFFRTSIQRFLKTAILNFQIFFFSFRRFLLLQLYFELLLYFQHLFCCPDFQLAFFFLLIVFFFSGGVLYSCSSSLLFPAIATAPVCSSCGTWPPPKRHAFVQLRTAEIELSVMYHITSPHHPVSQCTLRVHEAGCGLEVTKYFEVWIIFHHSTTDSVAMALRDVHPVWECPVKIKRWDGQQNNRTSPAGSGGMKPSLPTKQKPLKPVHPTSVNQWNQANHAH